MDSVVNFTILRNPINWLIVITVCILVAYSGFVVWNAAKGNLAV